MTEAAFDSADTEREDWVPPPSEGWQPHLKHGPPEEAAITSNILDPIGAERIPPRPWAYGKFLLFGSASVTGAVDGGGKGAIAVVIALAMITGKPLLGERVWRTGPVAIVSYEDDETEWHRRIAAACLNYELDYAFVLANVHFLHHHGGRVTFAATTAHAIVFPDGDNVVAILKNIGAAMLIVDPFNHAHDLDDGNNNVMIAKVAAELSRVAQESGAAVLVLHHLRKGSSGQPDDLMGATSLRATFRAAQILTRMTPEVAKDLGINESTRWQHIRIAGSKENYAPPPEKSTWFKLIGIRLGNTTDTYPDGDYVVVATTWQPRPLFEGMDASALSAVFAELRQKIHGPHQQARNTPWAGMPLMKIGGRTKSEAGKIVKAWIQSGVLREGTYYQKLSKRTVDNVTLDEEKVTEILAAIGVVNAPPR